MDISQHQLDFRALDGTDVLVEFLEISIAELQTIEEVKTQWPDVDSSTHLFGNSVGNAIRKKGLISSLIRLHLKPQEPPYDMKGVAYLDNCQVVPLVLKFSQNIDQWIETIQQSFSDSDPTAINFNITPTGTGTSYYYVEQHTSNLISLEGLEYSPVKFILRNAPGNFDPDATKAKKEEFTKAFAVAAPVLSKDEKQELKDKWTELIGGSSNLEESSTNLVKFDEFESLTGIPFPSELRAIYEVSDSPIRLGRQLVMRPFADLLLDWRGIKLNYDAWSMEDLVDFTETDGDLTSKIHLHTHRIPFALDLNGNQLAYDLIPGQGGQAGQIVSIEHAPVRIRCVSKNLHDFIGLVSKENAGIKLQTADAEAYAIELLKEPMRNLKKTVFKYTILSRISILKNVIRRILSKFPGR